MDNIRKLIREALYEMDGAAVPKKIVKFDLKSEAPYEIEISERGFTLHTIQINSQTGGSVRIGDFPARGRMSFEELKDALSKKIDLDMNSEKGEKFELTQDRMQDIMKYYIPKNKPKIGI